MTKKLFIFALIVSFSFGLFNSTAHATTAEDLLQMIQDLQDQLNDLLDQYEQLTGEPAGTITGCTITSFDRNLTQGMTGDDVKCLQIVLNSDSATKLADSGAGSPGNETSYFGPITKAAVIKFQEKYADEVLAYWGLTSGTGYVGQTTRDKLNSILAAGGPTVECNTDADCATGYECVAGTCALESITPVEGSTLHVKLAADTPDSTQIADAANAYFTKITFTAGDEDVSISKINVTRSGLTANSDLENVRIYTIDGVYKGSIGSFNVNSEAVLTFAPNLVIKAGESVSYYIRAGITDGATAGLTAKLGIAEAADIISDAEEVTGAFPIVGKPMTVVTLTIGSATFAEDGTTVDSKPDVGDTDVTVNQFKITAGSTEGITLESLTVMESGTAGLDDIANIELYDVTNGESLGTVANWSSDGTASWGNLNISIAKGANHRFKIMVDIVDGASLTINADGEDGTDVLASVKGNTYGFYITPSWTGTGKGTNDQTINAGALNVSKSASTPATSNIAPGDSVLLTVFDFQAIGEDVKVSALHLDFDLATMLYSEITNVTVLDENGEIVCGPADVATSADAYVNFTDTFIVPVGTHKYSVKAKIADAVSTGDTIQCEIDTVGTDITAKGMTSNESITVTPAGAVSGNVLTVAAGNLTATTLTQPPARTIAIGITDYIFMTASLDAGASGEDVVVTALVIHNATTVTATGDEIDNAEIWADLTSANSSRGDAYETKLTDSYNLDGTGETTFTLTKALTVPKGTFVKIAFVADVGSNSSAADTHAIRLDTESGDVTAYGAVTGATISVTPVGAGQLMTIAANGDADLSVDVSSPAARLSLDQQTDTVAIFKIAATTTNAIEDLDLDSIKITDEGWKGDIVNTYSFWHTYTGGGSNPGARDVLIGSAPGSTTVEIQIPDGTVTVPADGYVLITVKALFNNVDGTSVQNADTLAVTIAASGDVDLTGLASGQAVDPDDVNIDAASSTLYESYPVVTVHSSSPSGALVPKANMLLAVLDFYAAGDKDITFDGAADPDYGDEDDKLYYQISSLDGASTTPTLAAITIKDQNGNTIDATSTANGEAQTNILCDFTDKDFVIPAGQHRQLYFYVNTTGFITTGDYINLWLDADGTALNWSINYDNGDYVETDKIFKNDISAGTLVK